MVTPVYLWIKRIITVLQGQNGDTVRHETKYKDIFELFSLPTQDYQL